MLSMINKLKQIKDITLNAQHHWVSSKNDVDSFPQISQRLLQSLDLKTLLEDDFLKELLKTELPEQYYKKNDFSNFPLCISREQDVFVDLYFWKDVNTNIHNHHFIGAFGVLEGEVIQTKFNFTNENQVAQGVWMGDCQATSSDTLKPGDTQGIFLGDDFIHQSLHFHHKKAHTVTICLRTLPLKDRAISSFFPPGLKFISQGLEETKAKKLDAMFYFYQTDKTKFKSLILDFFNSLGLNEQVNLVNGISSRGQGRDFAFFQELNHLFKDKHSAESWFDSYQRSVDQFNSMISKIKLLEVND
jgi:hypothetical protein